MSPPRPPVSTEDLRALLAVSRAGRMVGAATLLGVDHTTVRRRIDRLESALGTRLLDRGADDWELTAIGRDVARRSAPLEEVVELAVKAASGGADGPRGTVRIAAPEGFAVAFAAPALARLRRESPELRTELVASTRPLMLRGAGFDLVITAGSPAGSRMSSERLAPYSVRLYASHEYLDAHAPIRTVSDLDAHYLVYYVDALLTVRELDLAPLLGGMRIGFGSTSASAQLEATRNGAGIGLLHTFMAERYSDLAPVLPDHVDFRLQFSLSIRPESKNLDAVAAVRRAIRDEIDRRRDELE